MSQSARYGILAALAVAVLALIVVPSWLRSRVKGGEARPVSALKTLAAAQSDYKSLSPNGSYAGSLQELSQKQFIDEQLASGTSGGYVYTMQAGDPRDGAFHAWSAEAHPVEIGDPSARSFYINQTGLLRSEKRGGKPGTAEMPEL